LGVIIRSVVCKLCGLGVVLALSTTVLSRSAAQSPAEDPLAALAERLDPQMPGADVSLLLDASGSMLGRYSAVRAAALRFAEGLSRGETLTARAFAANITQPISGRGAEARSILDAGLPREPLSGIGTDLGLALSKALDDLDRPDAAPIQALFVITDGLHQPPGDSPFSRDFEGDRDWLDLRRRAGALAQRSHLIVYGLGIGGQTDIGVLRRVFPARNVEILSGDAASAGAAMARLQRQMRLVRLKTLLERDIEQGAVTVSPQSPSNRGNEGTVTVPIVIQNAYQTLNVTVTGLHVEPAADVPPGISVHLNAPSHLRLGQGERSTLTLTVALRRKVRRWALGRHRLSIESRWLPVGEAQFEDRAALEILRLPSRPTFQPLAASVRIAVEYGKPWWLLIALGASAVLTVIGWKRRVTILPMSGLLGSIEVQGHSFSLADFPKDRITVGPAPADIQLPDVGANVDAVELDMGRDGDSAILTLHASGFGVSVNDEIVSGERSLSGGDTVRLGGAEFVVLDNGKTPACVRHPLWLAVPGLIFVALVILLIVM
jgi:hypothetical protein